MGVITDGSADQPRRSALYLALIVSLAGCGPGAPTCEDLDGDGFRDAACGGSDCDDTNADVRPDAIDPGDTWITRKMPGRGMPRTAVSPDGELWVVYVRVEQEHNPTDLRVGHWNGLAFDWETPPLSKPMLDYDSDIGMGDDGVLHLLLRNRHSEASPANIVYGSRVDGVWDFEELHTHPRLPEMTMAVTPDGDAVSLINVSRNNVFLQSLTDPDKPTEEVPVSAGNLLLIDEAGESAILGTPPDSRRLQLYKRDGDEWLPETVALYNILPMHRHGVFGYVGLRVQSDDLELRLGTGPDVLIESIGQAKEWGFHVATGADGSVHVVWHTLSNVVMYRQRSPDGVWSEPKNFGRASGYWYREPRVAVRPNGEVHVWHNAGDTASDVHIVQRVWTPGDGVDTNCDGVQSTRRAPIDVRP